MSQLHCTYYCIRGQIEQNKSCSCSRFSIQNVDLFTTVHDILHKNILQFALYYYYLSKQLLHTYFQCFVKSVIPPLQDAGVDDFDERYDQLTLGSVVYQCCDVHQVKYNEPKESQDQHDNFTWTKDSIIIEFTSKYTSLTMHA